MENTDTPIELTPRCEICKFLGLTPTAHRCHRFPPQAIQEGGPLGRLSYLFPVVHGGEWCGEFQIDYAATIK